MSADRSDVEVLAAVADGDRRALRVLYDRHAPSLALRLARRCADPGVVDEAIQDTFVAVWRGAGRYSGHSRFLCADPCVVRPCQTSSATHLARARLVSGRLEACYPRLVGPEAGAAGVAG